jgi:hypothetical protein
MRPTVPTMLGLLGLMDAKRHRESANHYEKFTNRLSGAGQHRQIAELGLEVVHEASAVVAQRLGVVAWSVSNGYLVGGGLTLGAGGIEMLPTSGPPPTRLTH